MNPILDKIDRMLAAHFGFTDEEVDLIPSNRLGAAIPSARRRAGNYDIEYRMDATRRTKRNEFM
jgi:hypothetical protein